MKTILPIVAASLVAISGFADQIVLKGAAAIAKFPPRLQNSEIAHLADASWCQLMPGVEYFYGRFDLLYNTTANDVSFYKIDYKNAPVRMKFVDNRRNGGSNKQTSYVANKYNALFGINCTFPAWFAKMENQVVKDGNKEGGLALNDDKTFEFFKSTWWSTHPNAEGYTDAFSTEAMGLYHGNQGLSGTNWGQAPYTFMGATQDGILYVCVVDGRTSRSEGLGYGTTHSFLVELGCYDGMCIDGGGSTTMVCRKDLMPPGMNELQHASDNSEANPYYYTMNHTADNPERAVCNQLLFVEDVAKVTLEVGSHGSCSLGTGTVKFDKNTTQNYTVTADTGYRIAYLAYQGQSIDAAKGEKSYGGSFLADGDKTITATFVKETAWWLNPQVKNDFPVEYNRNYSPGPIAIDEQGKDVFFALTVSSQASARYCGIVQYDIANLLTQENGTGGTPLNAATQASTIYGTGEYTYRIAASQAAGVVLAAQKTTNHYPIAYSLGTQWGDSKYGATLDERFLVDSCTFPGSGYEGEMQTHTPYPFTFSPDGKLFYACRSQDRIVYEYNVVKDASGKFTGLTPTGRMIKLVTTCYNLQMVRLNGKDVLIAAVATPAFNISVPADMPMALNSSSLQTVTPCLTRFNYFSVVGVRDGTPRIIARADYNKNEHANYYGKLYVYDLKSDLTVSASPIAVVDSDSRYTLGGGGFAALDDDSAAFMNRTDGTDKSLHGLIVVGASAPELAPVAKPTAATGLVYNGSAKTGVAGGTGYTVSCGTGTAAGSYTATATLQEGYCWADKSTDPLTICWSIASAPITITAKSYTVGIGKLPSALGYDITSGELAAGDALSGAPACAASGATVGTWPITSGTLTAANNPNYSITFIEGVLAVSKTPDWLDPAKMEGATIAAKTVAALKKQGFDDDQSAAIAGADAYGVFSEWAQNWADAWQTRGDSAKPMPQDIAKLPGVLVSAAIGADNPLKVDDIKLAQLDSEADGAYTLTVKLGKTSPLTVVNEALLKAALGLKGTYSLSPGQPFSADNLEVAEKTVGEDAVKVMATPKTIDGRNPKIFFFRATAK